MATPCDEPDLRQSCREPLPRSCRESASEHNIHGLRNADLRRRLPLNAGQISRLLEPLRVHALIERIGRTYSYYLTALGRRALVAGLHVRQTLVPRMLMADRC